MNESIIGVYNTMHHLIKEDFDLLKKIKELVSDPINQNSNKYLCTGLQVNGIYLGIDFIKEHLENFQKILANTLLIEDLSHASADFSRILLRLMINGEHVATLTEDVSENGKYEIYDEGISFGPVNDYHLFKYFADDIIKSVFVVYSQKPVLPTINKKDRTQNLAQICVRLPIIDLEHADLLSPYDGIYNEDVEKSRGDLFYLKL